MGIMLIEYKGNGEAINGAVYAAIKGSNQGKTGKIYEKFPASP